MAAKTNSAAIAHACHLPATKFFDIAAPNQRSNKSGKATAHTSDQPALRMR
jgi:hypothetical protein